MISALYLIARFWDETGFRGPSNAADTIHGHEVVTFVADQFRSSPTLAAAGDVQFLNNGNPDSENWPLAVEQLAGRDGHPLALELTVITGSDRTVIRHNAAGEEAAQLVAARLSTFLDPLPGTWPVEVELDATIPGERAGLRVAIGSVTGTLGGVSGWLGQEGFLVPWANAFTLGVYDYLILPVE